MKSLAPANSWAPEQRRGGAGASMAWQWRTLVFAAAAVGVALAPVHPQEAHAQDRAPNAVDLKRAIELHYAAKITTLLAPSFRQSPAVSVEVELDLDSVQRTVEKTADRERTVETLGGP